MDPFFATNVYIATLDLPGYIWIPSSLWLRWIKRQPPHQQLNLRSQMQDTLTLCVH